MGDHDAPIPVITIAWRMHAHHPPAAPSARHGLASTSLPGSGRGHRHRPCFNQVTSTDVIASAQVIEEFYALAEEERSEVLEAIVPAISETSTLNIAQKLSEGYEPSTMAPQCSSMAMRSSLEHD
jgi:hypothetical protein